MAIGSSNAWRRNMGDLLSSYLHRTKSAVALTDVEGLRPVQHVIVIPAKDEPDLITTLEALLMAGLAVTNFGVVVVFNGPLSDDFEFRQRTIQQLVAFNEWKHGHGLIPIHKIEHFDVDPKHMGVGDARKCGMDFALCWLEKAQSQDGLIVSLDADCVVAADYFTCLEKVHQDQSFQQGALYFEHRPSTTGQLDESIVVYESYLRYYKLAMQWAGHPQAMYTIGSTMVVRAAAYLAAGGMNRRQAGEDFYFLQKLCKSGPVVDLNGTTVYPSSRQSDRVPFGTGAAMNRWSQGDEEHRTAFALEAFGVMKKWLYSVPDLMHQSVEDWVGKQDRAVQSYIIQLSAEAAIADVKTYGTEAVTLEKRFYQWFNGLKALQFLKYVRESVPNQPIESEIEKLGGELGQKWSGEIEQLLVLMRRFEKGNL